MRWRLLENREQLAERAALHILARSRHAIEARGAFHLVLAGGETPRRTYERLSRLEAAWPHWHLYFGDERCLPAGDPDRNSEMVRASLTGRVPIPDAQVHPIPAELGPEAAADRYREVLRPVPMFDLVILGVGQDGHTASLFPGQAFPSGVSVIPVRGAPKPPAERVSLTPAALGNSREIIYLVAGEEKRAAVDRWRRGLPLPVAALPNRPGDAAFVERSAWSEPSR